MKFKIVPCQKGKCKKKTDKYFKILSVAQNLLNLIFNCKLQITMRLKSNLGA